MAKRFCTNCETFHDGSCSPTALARLGKGSKKPKDSAPPAPTKEAKVPTVKKPAKVSEPSATDSKVIAKLKAKLAKVEAEKAAQREATRARVKKHRAAKVVPQ